MGTTGNRAARAGSATPELGAVVLSGGSAVRIGGADKASIEVGGATLLEHVLAALAGITEVVVVGEEVPTSRPVTFRREDPPRGGPAAGLLAGVAAFGATPRHTVVLAVDMPMVTTDTVHRLVRAAKDGAIKDGAIKDGAAEDGALLVDPAGRRQYVCAVYRTEALVSASPPLEQQHGLSMRRLLVELDLAEVPAVSQEAHDLDTWEDLLALRTLMGE